jgi:hypothetical protein
MHGLVSPPAPLLCSPSCPPLKGEQHRRHPPLPAPFFSSRKELARRLRTPLAVDPRHRRELPLESPENSAAAASFPPHGEPPLPALVTAVVDPPPLTPLCPLVLHDLATAVTGYRSAIAANEHHRLEPLLVLHGQL